MSLYVVLRWLGVFAVIVARINPVDTTRLRNGRTSDARCSPGNDRVMYWSRTSSVLLETRESMRDIQTL